MAAVKLAPAEAAVLSLIPEDGLGVMAIAGLRDLSLITARTYASRLMRKGLVEVEYEGAFARYRRSEQGERVISGG